MVTRASSTTFTNILANSSLISYSGNWSQGTYQPLSDGATASIHYLGGGISWSGAGELGSDSINGGITTRIDASSSVGHNYTVMGSDVDPADTAQAIPLPFGRHAADFVFDGVPRNFTFAGFKMSTNWTEPPGASDVNTTITAADEIPIDQIQFYGETQTEAGNGTSSGNNTTVTYVQGANTGFAFNFSGVGLTVIGSPNASADVDYVVYFNLTEPPPPDSNIAPFDEYTQRTGTGGVIFYVGAMPAGNHRILFVNKGDTPLGLQAALVHWAGNYTSGLTACYVNCTAEQRQELAGTRFNADGSSGTSAAAALGLSWTALGLSSLSALGASLLG